MWAGYAKLRSLKGFAHTVHTFGLLPERPSQWVAVLLPFLELTCSACVLIGLWEPYPAILASALFLLFGAVLALALVAGHTP